MAAYGYNSMKVNVYDQARFTVKELNKRLKSVSKECTPPHTYSAVTNGHITVSTAPAHAKEMLHVSLAWGQTFHTSKYCPMLDPGSATTTMQEVEERDMGLCLLCTEWTEHNEKQRAATTIMTAMGGGKCFQTRELCPTLQQGHNLTTVQTARDNHKIKYTRCAHREQRSTCEMPQTDSTVTMLSHNRATMTIKELKLWCMSLGLESHGGAVDRAGD